MSDEKKPLPAQDAKALRSAKADERIKEGKPLFTLGRCMSTPAVLAYLAAHGVQPLTLLMRHQHGDWGNVDEDDAQVNNHAVHSGARLLSSFTVAYAVIWVITEAVGDDGMRAASTLLYPDEY
ncbi:hypothetical protein SAMN05518800_1870 [Variovorax sp. YR752]|uniref:hypothetical protein n=1 Tax=Variovorax sp. YR752 TaxID=1884383 RepID=UPI000BC44D2E|nr:hypothetical protein [Variovorax sp. YR752]SOD25361.1 hypothetical protein SAMN05518800_1870 [Variovorax sp. YR752]